MPVLSLLWLALLHALTLGAPLRPADAAAARAPVRLERALAALGGERWEAGARPHGSDEARRATYRAPTSLASRAAGTGTPGGVPPVAVARPTWPEPAAIVGAPALRHHGTAGHARAARGALLPYFPTAPPRQG